MDYRFGIVSRTRTPILAAVSCLVAFGVVLAVAYGTSFGAHADLKALTGLEAVDGSAVTPVASAASHFGDAVPLAVVVAALVGIGWASGRRRQAVAAVALILAAVVTAELLKFALAHPRMPVIPGRDRIGAVAFPSGHAAAATAVALAAVLVSPRRFRPIAAVAGTLYAVIGCTSIIVLGWHFPSDVFGGMLLAAFYFCVAVAVLRAWRQPAPEPADSPRFTLSHPAIVWGGALLGALALGVGAALAVNAGGVAAFAREHTLATATAVAVFASAAALVRAASLLVDG